MFVDDVTINLEITYPYDSWLLQSEINNIQMWYFSNYMKLNKKTRILSFCQKANWHDFDNKLIKSSIICRDCIRDLVGLIDKSTFSATGG
jgi:hypothetical protein